MKQAKYDINVQVGRSFNQLFIFDYDIADLTFTSQIKDTDGNLITSFLISKDNAAKSIVMGLSEVQTNLLTFNYSYVYDLKQVDNTLNSVSPFGGVLNLYGTVTN